MPPEYVLMWLPAGAVGLLSVLAVVNWIGVKVKAGKRDHRCGQTRLTVVAETGEIQELEL